MCALYKRDLRANVPACQRGSHANLLACQRGLRANVPECRCVKNVLTSHFYVPTCHKTCQFFNLACQRAKRRANFSTGRVIMPKSLPIAQTFLLRNVKWNFYTLLLYEKFYFILDIIITQIMCICIVHKNCIILHLYTSWCHLKEKCVEFLLFS